MAKCQFGIAGTVVATVAMGEHGFVEKGQLDCFCKRKQLNRMQCHSAKASKLSCEANYWSSTEYNATNAFNFNFNNGNTNNNNKTNTYSVRAVRDSSTKNKNA